MHPLDSVLEQLRAATSASMARRGGYRVHQLRMLIFLVGAVLPAHWVEAQDVSLNVLFLPDEAAECRYLETLSTKATDVLALTERQQRQAQALYYEGNTAQALKYFEALRQILHDTVQIALKEVADGIDAEKRKRGALPSCAIHIETLYTRQQSQYARLSRSIQEDVNKVSAAIPKEGRKTTIEESRGP